MSLRIAINGFGRIGRNVFRAALTRDVDLEIVAINDLASPRQLAQLLKFDSILGRFPGTVEAGNDYLTVNEKHIDILSERAPENLPWRTRQIDVVLESTGRFTSAVDARAHLDAGAGRVLVSAPSDGAELTIAYGINQHLYNRQQRILSNASGATNALAPLAKVLHDTAVIEGGFITTIHGYTQKQNLQHSPHHSDERRARATGTNIAPTSTEAARAIGQILPELDGLLEGHAIRVPVAVGALVELNVTVERDFDVDTINAAYMAAADGRMKGILEYSTDPLVSTDIVGNAHSSIFDSQLTRVRGRQVKVVGWYDNEWGFSNRVVDTLHFIDQTDVC